MKYCRDQFKTKEQKSHVELETLPKKDSTQPKSVRDVKPSNDDKRPPKQPTSLLQMQNNFMAESTHILCQSSEIKSELKQEPRTFMNKRANNRVVYLNNYNFK